MFFTPSQMCPSWNKKKKEKKRKKDKKTKKKEKNFVVTLGTATSRSSPLMKTTLVSSGQRLFWKQAMTLSRRLNDVRRTEVTSFCSLSQTPSESYAVRITIRSCYQQRWQIKIISHRLTKIHVLRIDRFVYPSIHYLIIILLNE